MCTRALAQRRSIQLVSRTTLALALTALVACGGKKQPAKTPAPAPDVAATAAAKPDTAPPPKSAVQTAREALNSPLTPASAKSQIAALDSWLQGHASSPEANDARALLAQLRLSGSALAIASGTGASADAKRTLDQALIGASDLATKGYKAEGIDGASLKLAAHALQTLAGHAKEPLPMADVAKAAQATTAGSDAVRLAWMTATKRAFDAAGNAAAKQASSATAALLSEGGSFVCAGCDTGKVSDPAALDALVFSKTSLCADASKASGLKRAEAALTCGPLGLSDGGETALGYGPNAFTLALGSQALSLPTTTSGPLAAASTKARNDVASLLARPRVLPAPLALRSAAEPAAADDARPAPLVGLGPSGLQSAKPAIATVVVGPTAIRGGLRPVVQWKSGKAHSLSAAHPLDGTPAITVAELAAKPRDTALGAHTVLVDLTQRVAKAADQASVKPLAEPGTFAVVLDAGADVSPVTDVLDGLHKGGAKAVRFLDTGKLEAAALPLWTRQAPKERLDSLGDPAAAPIIVVGTSDISIWRAPSVSPKAAANLPASIEPGYRGTELVRFRVPIPDAEKAQLSDATVGKVVEAIKFWQAGSTAKTPVAHVVGGPQALGTNILRVAGAYQSKGGTAPVADPAAVWPGTTCAAKDCPTAVAIAFSATAGPLDAGVTTSPVEAKPEPPPVVAKVKTKRKPRAKPAPKPKPAAASPEFCNKSDIKSNMNRKKGSFRFCYERQLQGNKTLQGSVTLAFTIGLSGSVSSARISGGTLKDKKVHQCILKQVKKISFKKPDGGACSVRWPFKFRAG